MQDVARPVIEIAIEWMEGAVAPYKVPMNDAMRMQFFQRQKRPRSATPDQ